ncbi:uncharacterized protein TA04825 [Theileria annulata]|uniref:Tpr-related protein family member n=1 Tax=Theileria annulata TaxID=5874 RepID=Q4UBU4_THEAN|nr:uncharacterized protein TA04825 [Theileria annulata]CAI75707.1 hypothetical protein, conserved [Theileria annulata]|eukprot:XP_955183.1 hypothetical protein, conserved [Theileria annulata]
MILLIATFFPPVIVALLNRGVFSPAAKARSPKTCPANDDTGMGGWREYTPASFCNGGQPVNNSFWHAFDTLLVIKISLVAAILWTIAYYKGEEAKDGFPPSDDNQRVCKILKLEADTATATATALTYSIEQDFAESHADDKCDFKNSVGYLAHLIPPSLMVLVGMGLQLPNLTIVTTVSSFVFIMELLFIVLDRCKINTGESCTTWTDAEFATPGETTREFNSSRISGDIGIDVSCECDFVIVVELSIGLDRFAIKIEGRISSETSSRYVESLTSITFEIIEIRDSFGSSGFELGSGPSGTLTNGDLSVIEFEFDSDTVSESYRCGKLIGWTNDNGVNLKNPGGDLKPPRRAKFYTIIIPSIVSQWLNFFTYVILLIVFVTGGEKLRKLAKDLHNAANELHSAAPGQDSQSPKKEAKELKEAVGDSEDTSGKLRYALRQLATAGGTNLPAKAQAVRSQYGEFGKYAIGGGHQVRALIDAKKYDIQSDAAQPGLKEKAGQLESKAKELQSTASGAEVSTAAEELKNKAGTLNGAATTLASAGGKLKELQSHAEALKDAAGKQNTGGDSLYAKANELAKGTPTDHDKAIAVINAFKKVKIAYDKLEKEPKYKEIKDKLAIATSSLTQEQQKVQNVEGAWTQVKAQFEALCKALIKEFATLVATNTRDLASNSGTQASTHANNVISNFDVVERAYKELDDKSSLESEFNALKLIYERILNLTKLIKLANDLQQAAQSGGTLQGPAQELVTKVTALRDGNANQAHENAKTVIQNYEKIVTEYNNLTEDDKGSVKEKFLALKNVYDKILNVTKMKQQKLKQQLVKDPGTATAAARVLKAKAGTGPHETGKLRKLARLLYEAANTLAGAVKAGNVQDSNAANELATAVGANETGGSFREKLKDLYDQTQDDELKQKATKVKDAYDNGSSGVLKKFNDVVEQESKYKEAGKEPLYKAVVSAMTEFDNVYKPEELLKDAVDSLQEALTALAEANILHLHSRAEVVKEKFEGFGTVKSKFELVQKQVAAYDAGGIKASHYDPVKTDLEAFQTDYRDAIYPPKFNSIVVPSIISILSVWSPKTEFLLYPGSFKFGGWTEYKANDISSGPVKEGDHVYDWICTSLILLIRYHHLCIILVF